MNFKEFAEQSVKIWLDDERSPYEGFWQREKGARGDEVWVKTAPEAIELLKTGNVSYISLDHDLGGEINGNGYDVCKFLEKGAYLYSLGEAGEAGGIPPLKWRIHTDNGGAMLKMYQAMKKADEYWNTKK